MRDPSLPRTSSRFHNPILTHHENKAVEMALNNFSNAEISDEMCIDIKTVNRHLCNSRKKLPALAIELKFVPNWRLKLRAKRYHLAPDVGAIALAERLSVSHTTLYSDIHRWKNLTQKPIQRRRPIKSEERFWITTLFTSGKSYGEIALILNRSRNTIASHCRYQGLRR